ncbi:hypothetical protein [Sideroxydans lithotrophicus]|uniref:Transmembrane protein n=1 Tax=Sideroxydans lithotrophicus (strain ES-1) TaxID=580332 RepID=D5CS42_SIDLE|nr:hypothetical protein [Sideroxydans lithotrophicus]ADE11778.1 hypothetical protein Slit_1542 [Sideroxydans lithotrophicus ES-1]
MNDIPSRRHQRGYLLEIPILLVLAVLILSAVLPNLPPLGQKILIALFAIPILFFLYYMIVVPGWTPGDKGRLSPPWNMILFLIVAAAVIFVVIAFAFGT